MKIAVIGTGISGNVAAYHLSRQHDITVYEAGAHIGGHTHTHDIVWGGKRYAVDSGFIVFNDWTYPNFQALLGELKVSALATEMSFSVRDDSHRLEYNGHSLNTLFAQRRNLVRPAFYRLIRDILAFNRSALKLLEPGGEEITMGEYLAGSNYSAWFKHAYILPMGAAIWSTDVQRMLDFPARFFVQFFRNHGLLNVNDRPQWYVVKGGSKQYVAPLVRRFRDRIRLNCAVRRILRAPEGVYIDAGDGQNERYDAVFIATHSDQALAMLADPSPRERDILGAIRYQHNEALLHTDSSILPVRQKARAAWNYYSGEDRSRLAVTYHMNTLQHLDAPVDFCVSLNSDDLVDKRKIIDRVDYEHPVFTPESLVAQARLDEINGSSRTYYCGAYWANGFHEDGVVSALRAVEAFEQKQHEQQDLLRAG